MIVNPIASLMNAAPEKFSKALIRGITTLLMY